MLKRHKTSKSHPVAIEAGAFRTRIVNSDTGMLLDQPSIGVLDMDHHSAGVDAIGPFGNRAQEMLETGVDQLRCVQPIQSDNINELGYTQKMLRYFIADAKHGGILRNSHEVNLVIPHTHTQQQAELLIKCCAAAGVSKVRPVDAAISAYTGTQQDQNQLCLLIDFGATNSRVIAIENGTVLHHQTLGIGGDTLEQTIYDGILEQYQAHLTPIQVRQVKHRLAAATPRSLVKCTSDSMQLDCLSISSNSDTRIVIDTDTVNRILRLQLEALSCSIRESLTNLAPSFKDAAYNTGVQLCGGGALLSRIEQLVMSTTDLPVQVVNKPMTCAVRGAARLYNNQQTGLPTTEPA